MTIPVEVRPYIDMQLHVYRKAEFTNRHRDVVTPLCAEVNPFYATDHERRRVGDPVTRRLDRHEIHSSCLVAARKLQIPVLPSPSPRRHRERDDPTLAGSVQARPASTRVPR